MLQEEQDKLTSISRQIVADRQAELVQLSGKMQRLTDAYLEQLVDRPTFVEKKAEILQQKKTLQEQIALAEKNHSGWLELFKEWIKRAGNIGEIAGSGTPQEKKDYATQVFGSNLFLDRKEARGDALKPWSLIVESSQSGGMVRTLKTRS